MNILVLLRAVRDPASFVVNRKAQKVFVNRQNFIINPSDRNALEAALQLSRPSDTVIAVALGDAPAEDVLRQALASGATRAVLVKDAALKQADGLVMANVLQRMIGQLGGADIVLLGSDVLDSDTAQVGPRLAQAVNWPLIAGAHRLARDDAGLTVIAPAGKEFHLYRVTLPAVVTIARDSNQPRYAPGARIITIYQTRDAAQILSAADLGLSEDELRPATEYRGESFPPERELGRRLEGDLEDIARQVAEVIRKI